jgi:hypothetical protein
MERVGSPRRRARLVCGAVAVALALAPDAGADGGPPGRTFIWDAAGGSDAVWQLSMTTRSGGRPPAWYVHRPTAIEAGADAAWVTNYGPPRAGRPAWDRAAGFLLRIGPRTGRVTDRIRVGRFPSDIALTSSAAWVANARDGTVQKVSLERRRIVARPPVRPGFPADRSSPPIRLGIGGSSIWACSGQHVARIDAVSGAILQRFDVAPASAVTVAHTSAGDWLVLQGERTIVRRVP